MQIAEAKKHSYSAPLLILASKLLRLVNAKLIRPKLNLGSKRLASFKRAHTANFATAN